MLFLEFCLEINITVSVLFLTGFAIPTAAHNFAFKLSRWVIYAPYQETN